MINREDVTYQYLFRAISHQIKLVGDEKLDKYELTNYQGLILRYIDENKNNGVSQVELEKATNRKGPSITNMLKILEKNGFIYRRVDQKDERRKLIYLLPKAKDLLNDFDSLFYDMESTITKGFDSNEKDELQRLLKKILGNLEK